MRTYKRICLRNFRVADPEGNVCELYRGAEYITSEVDCRPAQPATVTVFTDYWITAPAEIFGGEEIFTK